MSNEAPSIIPGIKKLNGQRIDRFEVPGHPNMAVFITNVDFGDKREPALFVGRRVYGRGRSVIVPLSVAYQYNDPALVAEKVYQASHALFDQPTQADAHLVMDLILKYLPMLFTWQPEREKTPDEIIAEAAAYRLKVEDSSGNSIIDTTH